MAFQEGRALLIGVGDYLDEGLPDVPVTVGDATALRDVLLREDVAGYLPDRVSLLQRQSATKAGIFGALESLANTVVPTETVFIFFAGHGLKGSDDRYHLAAHDTVLTPGRLARQETGVGQGELLDALRAIKAEKMLVVLNACFAGRVSATLGPEDAVLPTPIGTAPTEDFNKVLATGEGRVVITACRPNQESGFMTGSPRTYFGQALCEAFDAEGVPDANGVIGVYDLYIWANDRARLLAAQGNHVQDAVVNIAGGIGRFPIAIRRTRSGAIEGAALHGMPPGPDVHVISPGEVASLANVRDAPRGLAGDWQLEVADEAPNSFTLFLHTADGSTRTVEVVRSPAGSTSVRLDGAKVGRFRGRQPVQFDLIDGLQLRHRIVIYSTRQTADGLAPLNIRINGQFVIRDDVPVVSMRSAKDSGPGNPDFDDFD